MPLFYFNLRNNFGLIQDPDGTNLSDEGAAREHAQAVACELMRNAHPSTRSWRLEVCDSDRQSCFDLMLVAVDSSISHLPLEAQRCIIDGWTKSASLRDAIQNLQLTLHQVKGTIARADGAPYLAAINGVRL
jgi:hypothetical protein